MTPAVLAHFGQTLKHLYINPLEKCNLKCEICYTRKTSPVLPMEKILEFVAEYQSVQKLETITFCGGEVFVLPWFPELLNQLTAKGIFCQVITNGTIDRLSLITNPNFVNLIVSIDGTEALHDANRGKGMFRKSLDFMKKAKKLGFHEDVFSIVHKQNLDHIEEFEQALQDELGFLPVVTYHPRKPPMYLNSHPISNIFGKVEEFDFLTKVQMIELMKTRNVFPPKELGCYQIAVASDGKVYGCCEGTLPLGTLADGSVSLIEKLKLRLEDWSKIESHEGCLGCSQPDFMCGIKEYLEILHGTKLASYAN